MSWAASRRLLILAILASVGVLIVAGILIATFYTPASCVDNKKNQDEEGIDCGGGCTYLCKASVTEPSILFVRAIPAGDRTDVIAYVENQNPTAAVKGARYSIELFSPERAVLAKKEGTVDLPPGGSVPIFIPNFYAGGSTIGQAFLTFDDVSFMWYRYDDTRVVPKVENSDTSGLERPRVTAVLRNPSVQPLRNVKVVATVFDAENQAIAASQTVIPTFASEGSATATFTWNIPFMGEAARIDVRPLIPLP